MKIRDFFSNVDKEFLDSVFEAKSIVKKQGTVVKKQNTMVSKPAAAPTKPENKTGKSDNKKIGREITPEQKNKWNKEFSASEQNWTIKNSPNGVYATAVKNNIIKLKDPSGKIKPEEHDKDDTERGGEGKPIKKDDSIKIPAFDKIDASNVPDDQKKSRLHDVVDKMEPDKAKEFLNSIAKKHGGTLPPWAAEVHNHWKDVLEKQPEKSSGKEKGEEKPKLSVGQKEDQEPHPYEKHLQGTKYHQDVYDALRSGNEKQMKKAAEKLNTKGKKDDFAAALRKIEKGQEKERKDLEKMKELQVDPARPRYKENIIDGQDKTLYKVNSKKDKVFTEPLPVSDKEFKDKIKNFKGMDLSNPDTFAFSKDMRSILDTNVPEKYITMMERMINSKKSGLYDPPISFFTKGIIEKSAKDESGGGAGQISSQAGEIMAMIGATLNDKDAKKFFDEIRKHVKDRGIEPDRPDDDTSSDTIGQVVDMSWPDAAETNRIAIHNSLRSQFPGFKPENVINGIWDVEDEYKALGVHNPKENKGESTDCSFKVKVGNEEKFVEVSLKKNGKIFLLNTGAAQMEKWASDLHDDVKASVYSERQKKILVSTVSKFRNEINKLLKSSKGDELKKIMKAKKIDSIDDALGANNKHEKKVLKFAIKALADSGNKEAQKAYETSQKKLPKEFAEKAVKALVSNDKLKEGMLDAIKKKLPLKAIAAGSESMAVGPKAFNPTVMKKMFGTNNWEEIKENLVPVYDEKEPYIGYQVDAKGTIIPIATIRFREKGIGYAGMGMEMLLRDEFDKKLDEVNKEVYGDSYQPLTRSQVERAAEKERSKKDKETRNKAVKDALDKIDNKKLKVRLRKSWETATVKPLDTNGLMPAEKKELEKYHNDLLKITKTTIVKSSYDYPWWERMEFLVEKYIENYK